MNPRPWSLFRRLVLGFGISYFLLLSAALALLYALLARGLEAEKYALLADRVDAVDALLKSPAHGMEELRRRTVEEWPLRSGEKIFVRVEDSGHQPAAETPDTPAALTSLLRGFDPEPTSKTATRSSCHPFQLPELGFYGCIRVVENSAYLPGPVRVFAFVSREETTGFLERFREIALLVLLVSVLASAGIGWKMAQLGMRPIRFVAREVGRFGSHNLHERVSPATLPNELHGLADAFNQTLNRIEESFHRLSRFSADIAHELRTPINNMMGEIEVALGRSRSAEEYAEVLTSNLEECGRLVRMVESMLFLARAENLDYELRREPVHVREELGNIREFFEAAASERSITLSVQEAPGEEDWMVPAEPTLFQRAVGNLLANAIQYTPEGGVVTLACARREGFVEVSVTDNGVGIATEHLDKIFDRFYRVDFSRNQRFGGVGLGLAIVKSILELHGGSVRVESAPGRGTTFRASWPIFK